MNEKEKFEDIIESKFSEAEFPFDENNWDGAEEMITSFRKKEKMKRFGLIFLSGIAIGVLIMFPFVNKINEKDSSPIAEAQTGSSVETKETNSNLDEQAGNTKSQSDVKQGYIADEVLTKVNDKKEETGIKSNNIAENEGSKSSSSSSDKVRSKRSTRNKGIQFGASGHNSIGTSFKHKNNNHTEQQNANTPASENGLAASNAANSTDLIPENNKLVLFPKLNKNKIETNDSVAIVEHLLDPEKLSADYKQGFMPSWKYTAAFGANYVSHFSVNPIQGLEVSRTIAPKIEVGTGAYYTYLTVLSGGVKAITTHTTYDFGYQSDITEIKTKKLHYIVIPVYAKYNINDKNTLMAGTNIYALFTSSNSLTTYKESYGEKQNVSSKKASGYSNGINNYDIGLFAGYKRNLFGNLGAAIYFNYGLKDIKKNDYYDENKFERNISGQFMVTYKL